ncbi:DUF4302 domain-containing protein [Hoylesella loescheii]|jgi:hypothetical protein|uniref:DUF4302 domain-containing protein n=1 Tax=Hoylesella loescheii TaxID=840 RepID=UPI000F1C8B77|nr:DUF4302 domain-containing protein [Hoylesella loescheii]RKW62558.1 MAG: DUF4302 domain-containing protein [Prevotella sp.]
MNKIYYRNVVAALVMLVGTLGLQSCLKEQTDVFDKSSSLREEEYMDKAQATLINAPYGWAFDIYPKSDQSYGGYAFTLKFDKEKCEVRSVVDASRADVSYYKMTAEVGPAISFDTYNPLMHHFSNPSQQSYQALEGDFLFVVDSISDNLIKVHGYRSKNVMYLRKLDMPAATYINKVDSFSSAFTPTGLWSFKGNVNGTEVEAELDATDLQLAFTSGGKTTNTAITFTDKGIRTYSPLQVGNTTINELTFNATDSTFTAKAGNDGQVKFKAFQPQWFATYVANVGNYVLEANYISGGVSYPVEIDVELEPMPNYKGYFIKNAIKDLNIRTTFDRKEHVITVAPQSLTPLTGSTALYLCTYDMESGYLSPSPKSQFALRWNDADKSFVFEQRGTWDKPSTGWFLAVFDSRGGFRGSVKQNGLSNTYYFSRAYEKLDQLLRLRKD